MGGWRAVREHNSKGKGWGMLSRVLQAREGGCKSLAALPFASPSTNARHRKFLSANDLSSSFGRLCLPLGFRGCKREMNSLNNGDRAGQHDYGGCKLFIQCEKV